MASRWLIVVAAPWYSMNMNNWISALNGPQNVQEMLNFGGRVVFVLMGRWNQVCIFCLFHILKPHFFFPWELAKHLSIFQASIVLVLICWNINVERRRPSLFLPASCLWGWGWNGVSAGSWSCVTVHPQRASDAKVCTDIITCIKCAIVLFLLQLLLHRSRSAEHFDLQLVACFLSPAHKDKNRVSKWQISVNVCYCLLMFVFFQCFLAFLLVMNSSQTWPWKDRKYGGPESSKHCDCKKHKQTKHKQMMLHICLCPVTDAVCL